MGLIEILSLIAGFMTMAAPMAQAVKTIRTRDVEGMSPSSYLMLLVLGVLSVLIGVQYRIATMTVLNTLATLANISIMYLLSRRLLFTFFGSLAALAAIFLIVVPWLLPTLITTKWAEPVAFVYGIVAASTFLPQVMLTRRTRKVGALSMPNLVLFTTGMAVWIAVSILLGNYSLIFWNGCLLLMMVELLRLKIVVERHAREFHVQVS